MKTVNFIIVLIVAIGLASVVDLLGAYLLQNIDYSKMIFGETFWIISTGIGRFSIGCFVIAPWAKELYKKFNQEQE